MTDSTAVAIVGNELALEIQWLERRNTLLQSASSIQSVESDADLSRAGTIQTEINKHIKALGNARLELTRKLDAVKKDIMNQERDMAADLSAELARIKRLNDAYATRLAAEAEAERRRQQDVERERQAAEAAKQIKAQELFGAEATVTPEPSPAPYVEPEKPKLENNRMRKRWTFTVINDTAVPREFLSINEQAIRAHINYCDKIGKDPVIPGVAFVAHMSVESR